MRFSVSQSALDVALSVVSKGMATASTIPTLSGVYMKAADGVLELQTVTRSLPTSKSRARPSCRAKF